MQSTMTTKHHTNRAGRSKYATPLSLAVVVGTVLTGNSALAAEHGDYYRYGDHMWGMGSGWVFGGFAMMFLFWAVVIALIVWGVRWATGKSESGSSSDSALGILKERLARGEIEPTEYEERRKALGK